MTVRDQRNAAGGILVENLFDCAHTIAGALFRGKRWPWEVLDELSVFILGLGNELSPEVYTKIKHDVWVAADAKISPMVCLEGPLIVDCGAEIRTGALIRGGVIVGRNAVVGNSTELKNCILFDDVQVPHFNYVGDSVLGYRAHMGAGAVTSNVRCDKKNVVVHGFCDVPTNRRKLGAMVGDRAEIGCNSVLNPGTVVGRDSIIYPASCVRGVVPEASIWKEKDSIIRRKDGL